MCDTTGPKWFLPPNSLGNGSGDFSTPLAYASSPQAVASAPAAPTAPTAAATPPAAPGTDVRSLTPGTNSPVGLRPPGLGGTPWSGNPINALPPSQIFRFL